MGFPATLIYDVLEDFSHMELLFFCTGVSLGSICSLYNHKSLKIIGRGIDYEYIYVADTGRKRTLFPCKWANSISYISRMLYSNHSRFSVPLYE